MKLFSFDNRVYINLYAITAVIDNGPRDDGPSTEIRMQDGRSVFVDEAVSIVANKLAVAAAEHLE